MRSNFKLLYALGMLVAVWAFWTLLMLWVSAAARGLGSVTLGG